MLTTIMFFEIKSSMAIRLVNLSDFIVSAVKETIIVQESFKNAEKNSVDFLEIYWQPERQYKSLYFTEKTCIYYDLTGKIC